MPARGGGGVPAPGVPAPGGTWWGPPRRLLLWVVRILLECILVLLKVELYALPGSGGAKLWALALAPFMMKLAFLSEFVEVIKSRSTVMCSLGSLINQNLNDLNRAH